MPAALAAVRAVAVDVEPGDSVERGWAALRSRLDARPTAAKHRSAPWWKLSLQVALAAQAVVMLILVGALIATTTRNEPYRAMGGAPEAVEANALAVFRADATEQQMREALRASGARIVGGPTISDAYLLRLVDLQPAALARLRAQPGVLRVESLQGAGDTMKAFVVVCLLLGLVVARANAADADGAARPAAHEQQVLVLLSLPPAHFRPDGNYTGGYADAAGSATRRRIAAALARSNGLSLATDWPLPILGLDCYVMDVPVSQSADDVAVRLARDPRVAWAQAMNVFHPLGHDDPLFSLQPAASEWHLDELHATVTGRGIRVAVIDSSVQLDHPDLAGQVSASANFIGDADTRGEIHGTAVAGIIAARADNHVGIAGVAPGARLFALRACRQATPADTSCTTLSLATALHSAIERGAQVINLSLGGPPDRLIEQLIGAAFERGIAVVAAADRSLPRGGFPATVRGVVAVVDETSGAAPAGMVSAPGTDVPATLPGSRWATVSGPSYAAAHVSGLLALMLDARDGASGPRPPVARALVVRADGRVDACASVLRAGAPRACSSAAELADAITRP